MDPTKVFERYLRHRWAGGSSPMTLEWHTYSRGQFVRYLTATCRSEVVADLTADDLRGHIAYLRERCLTQSPMAIKVRSVKAWGKWPAAEEYVRRDPFAGQADQAR